MSVICPTHPWHDCFSKDGFLPGGSRLDVEPAAILWGITKPQSNKLGKQQKDNLTQQRPLWFEHARIAQTLFFLRVSVSLCLVFD
jgi:hypothetical protein